MHVGIVGAGPAGISAALFLSRYDIEVSVFEQDQIGGLIINAWRVENFPVFEPMSGEQIAEILKKRLLSSPVELIFEQVTRIKGTKIKTHADEFDFDRVIVASGTVPVRITQFEVAPNVVYEYRFLRDSINSLAVYGAGDVAFDSALKAKQKGVKHVCIFNRTKRIKALPRLVDYAKNFGIIYLEEEEIQQVEPGLIIHTNKREYKFDALLISIGRVPNIGFVEEQTAELYIVGDARGGFRQMSIAIGNAIETAMRIVSEVS